MRDCGLRPIAIADSEAPILYSGHFWFKSHEYDVNKVFVKKLLQEKKIDCNNLKTLSFTLGQNAFDQLLSFIPFVRRSTVVIRGTTI